VSRDYEPAPGQWYENLEEEEQFRVLSVDEDSELIEIEYLDGDIEELDVEAWHEMDLEKIPEPEAGPTPTKTTTRTKRTKRRRKTKTKMRTTTIGMTTTMRTTTTSTEEDEEK